jgi:hypothetical protein
MDLWLMFADPVIIYSSSTAHAQYMQIFRILNFFSFLKSYPHQHYIDGDQSAVPLTSTSSRGSERGSGL